MSLKCLYIVFNQFYNKINKKYAKGAIKIKLSNLSSIPPCPGSKLLKSFIPTYRLILDAAKSPICPIILSNKAIPLINI